MYNIRSTATTPAVCSKPVSPYQPKVVATRRVAFVCASSATLDATSGVPSMDSTDFRWGLALEQGPRDTMEDVAQVIEKAKLGFLFATVFDGHGGSAAASYLQEHFYDVVSEILDKHGNDIECSIDLDEEEGLCCPIQLHAALTESFKNADAKLLHWLSTYVKDEDDARSGCTATALLVRPELAVIANVGDSRAVLSRGGKAIDLTTEHRVYGKGATVSAETDRVESVGGWVDDGRVCGVLAVSRAFGDPDFKGNGLHSMLKRGITDGFWSQDFADGRHFSGDPVTVEPDVFELSLQENDEFLIVATDGLWDVVSSQEAITMARGELYKKGRDPQAAADLLVRAALRRRTQDNVAAVVVELQKADLSRSARGSKLFGLF